MEILDSAYWQRRYKEGHTGWDVGAITTPLKEYFDQIGDKELSILIPGAGNAYEAEYLHQLGFSNVFVLDFAQAALQHLAERIPDFPSHHLIEGDFFTHDGAYDLIIEQTFLSAIDPSRRREYAKKMSDLLTPKGKLVGVLWSQPMGSNGPPYGGTAEEYRELFGEFFEVLVLADAYNSIAPRAGTEVFISLRKR